MSSILLRIQNLYKIFKSKKQNIEALSNVSLDIHQGEVLSMLGPNGAGKTTLSNILATLNPPTSGNVLFKGESIYKDIPGYRKLLGYCPQYPGLNPKLTLRQNLEFDGRFYGLSKTEIQNQIKLFTEQFGLGKYLNLSAEVLSGGYTRRFAIARTLMHNPEIVILDEPTVGLDPHARRQLWKYIHALKNKGVTVLLTTHYLDEAEQLSDRICFFNKGKLLFIDSPANIKSQHDNKILEDIFNELVEEEEIQGN